MRVEEITPLVLTFNEAPNIRRTLERIAWAKDVLVLDSFSSDETLKLAKQFPHVRVLQREFDTHSSQWNFGVDHCCTPWILALDADYLLSEELVRDLQTLEPEAETAGYFAHIRYCIHGRRLRGALYPPRAVLFRKDKCCYEQDGHTQRLRISGKTGWLKGCIYHDDRKPLSNWVWAQDRYATLESHKLLSAPATLLDFQDRVRRWIIVAPLLMPLYVLLVSGLILDGWAGWYYAFQRTVAEMLLSLHLIEAKLMGKSEAVNSKTGRDR